MIGPVTTYGLLGIVERFAVPRDKAPPVESLTREAMAALAAEGLNPQRDQLLGERLVLPRRTGNTRELGELRRHPLYSLAHPDEVLAAVRAHVARIAEHGPGDVWFLGGPVHTVDSLDDDAISVALVTGEETPYVVLRTFYGHEKQINWSALR